MSSKLAESEQCVCICDAIHIIWRKKKLAPKLTNEFVDIWPALSRICACNKIFFDLNRRVSERVSDPLSVCVCV